MKLPKDLLTQTYTKPRLFLCETDKSKICQLDTTETRASLKFNSYSELSFTVGRTYIDVITGETKVNPYYHKIEALRLIYLESFGYFEIQDPELVSDGIREAKNVTANSLEYTLAQKYLENFYVNTGENNSVEVIYAENNSLPLAPVTLYNIGNPDLSLLNLILEKTYGWSIGHVDASLTTMSRTFEISRVSVYDFIIQDICDKFNCYAVFDTINNTINLYAEALISKFIGDGATTEFLISPAYVSVGSVSIDSYKTTAYMYDPNTGILTFDEAPDNGARIEVTDGSQEQWTTDVYVTFDNLVQEINVSYSADDIKTVLTVKGAEDLDIREVNFGLPYITDLSYYYTVDWMGKDLYDAYTLYLQKCNGAQSEYKDHSQQMLEISNYIYYETHRLSLEYSIASNVSSTTVGTYYVRGGSAPNYYYTEVTLPADYNASVEHYYTLSGNDVNEEKVADLYAALQVYYKSGDSKTVTDIDELAEYFAFMEVNTIEVLSAALKVATTTEEKDQAVNAFLDEIWKQLGLTPLKTLYYAPYVERHSINVEAGWNEPTNENYWLYYPVTLMISSIDKAIKLRTDAINGYKTQYNELQNKNNEISTSLLLANNFTDIQLIRLNSFLREDEYVDETFVETDSDTTESIMQTKQELLECGRIELSKLCEPKLAFSMDMANIYALPEFEPIVHQFQLGKLINVVIRSDYIKRARLLQVDVNFEDFSDFTCEFGELTNLKTPSSIHADLLASAMQAGKSVASNASYWDKGAELATSTDLKIQQGLLDATNGLYSSTQGVVIDKHGIRLTKIVSPETGEVSPNQAWLVNNNILFSSDGFKTSRVGLGEFTVDGTTFYGLLAEAVLSGYIEGSTIVGGTINIGDGTFVVNSDGSVVMKATSIDGYVEEDGVISSINQSPEAIAINANRISLAGKTIDLTSDDITINSTNFSVTKEGKITAKNADIEGKITASSGAIGGWTIDSNSISGTSGNYKALISKSAIGASGNVVFGVYDGSAWSCYMDGVGKLYASNADIKGKITATSGSIGGCSISNGVLNVDAANITSGTINNARIGNLSADKITTGTLHVDRIPSFNADKITAGTISVDRIPNLSANKITSGTINASNITVTNLNASNITTGTLSANRLSSSVITTGNFSSKELSTGNLTVSGGSKLGYWTVTSSGGLTCGSGTSSVGLSSSGVSHGSGWTATWYDIIQAGNTAYDERLKTDISEFEDVYDNVFDNLRPVSFRYNVDPERLRFGFVAQDVKENFESEGINDFGGIYAGEGEDIYYRLLKEDFIALNTWQIQKLKTRIEELENKLSALES